MPLSPEETSPTSPKSTTVWGISFLALCLALGVTTWRVLQRATPAVSLVPVAEEPPTEPPSVIAPVAEPRVDVRPKGAWAPRASKPPIIDAAYVDKLEVCRGEENFVNVQARTEDGTDPFLTVFVTDPSTGHLKRGARVPFRMSGPSSEDIQIFVQGIDAERSVTLPPVVVKDCDAPVLVNVRPSRSFAARDRMTFTASVEATGAAEAEFRGTEYIWDFGDGRVVTSSSARIEHSYEARPQRTKQSSFVVTVEVRDRQGRTSQGSTSVTLSNFGFVSLALRNEVTLQTGARGGGSSGQRGGQSVWLYHGYDQPVQLTEVRVREVRGAEDAAREVAVTVHSPARVLGFSQVRVGESPTIENLAALAPSEPGAIRHYEVRGRTSDGKLASGTFTLLPFGPATTEGEAVPATTTSSPSQEMDRHEITNL